MAGLETTAESSITPWVGHIGKKWRPFSRSKPTPSPIGVEGPVGNDVDKGVPTKWSMGVLNDASTHEVPGNTCCLFVTGKALTNHSQDLFCYSLVTATSLLA